MAEEAGEDNPEQRRAPRASKAVVRERLYQIYKLRLHGKEFPDLCKYAEENNWGISRQTLWRYISDADRMCDKYFAKKASNLLSRHVMQRRLLLDKCLAGEDYRTALEVLKDEARLAGLYPAKKSEIKQEHTLTPTGDGPAVSDPETMRLAYEFAKRASGGDACSPTTGVPDGPASVGDGSEPGAVPVAPAPDVPVPEADAGS